MLALVLLLTSVSATKGGVTMPDSITVDGKPLVLNGLGIREATIFNVDVYVAGLYLEKKAKSGSEIISGEGTKRLVLRFVRDVDRDDITKAWKEGFEKNGGDKLGAQLKELSSWMPDVKEGQDLVFTYVPDKGLSVTVSGTTKGSIPGAEFARVFFSIFLGPSPPNAGLKRGLLGS